jgi:hypothetical protein
MGDGGIFQTSETNAEAQRRCRLLCQRPQVASMDGVVSLCAAEIPRIPERLGAYFHAPLCRDASRHVGTMRSPVDTQKLWESRRRIQDDRATGLSQYAHAKGESPQ